MVKPCRSRKNKWQIFQESEPSEEVKVGPSESMSKSKKNVIDPEYIIDNYSDSVRLFILSDSPPEKDVHWSSKGWYHLINLFKSYGCYIGN